MTWFMVSDDIWAAFEAQSLSARAQALWVRAGSYSCQQLTDGRISRREITLIRGTLAAAQELVTTGFWAEDGAGFVFKSWGDSQATREQVEAKREKWKRAKSRTSVDSPARTPRAPVPSPLPIPIPEETTTTTECPSVVSAPPAWVPKSKTRPDLDGFNWFNTLKGGAAPPLHTCKVDYEWIGGRPAPERHQVAQSIANTQWCADNRRNVTPAHVVKYWESYLEGPRNRQQIAVSVNPIDVAHGLMKSAEKAYHEAHRYNEPTEPALAAWEAATAHYQTVSKARAS